MYLRVVGDWVDPSSTRATAGDGPCKLKAIRLGEVDVEYKYSEFIFQSSANQRVPVQMVQFRGKLQFRVCLSPMYDIRSREFPGMTIQVCEIVKIIGLCI